MPATVKDVAKAADVSIGTVSRVLSGEPNVADETARRVMEAVNKLGYSRLRKRKLSPEGRQLSRKNIAMLLLGMDRSLVSLPSVACGIHGAESALSAAGANVLLADLPRVDEIPKSFASQNIHGLLAKGALQGKLIESAAEQLIERLRRIPTVWFLGRPQGADWGDTVESNDTEVGRLAADYLIGMGHKQIAILDPKPDHVTLGQRCASFTWHATNQGARVENVFGASSDWTLPLQTVNEIERVDKLVAKVLRLRSKPTAVFCPADCISAMVYHACARRGLQIGKDISLISCNNELPLLTGLYPEVTTIDICAEQIGRQAVEQLIWRLDHPDSPMVSVSAQPRLVEGMSVRNIARSKR
ncbi:LacI family DNA-binding transcriptional regulator [Stieleria mannarensis]|uniref:LacI family DNA-binding transcriptional regulator n=1 Tax=Stieleria mannarensis TaxID=2755585 RepID=UPI00160159E1